MLKFFFKWYIIPIIPDIETIKGNNHSKGLIDKRILLLPVYIPTLSIGNKILLTIKPTINIQNTITVYDKMSLTYINIYSVHTYKLLYLKKLIKK